MMWGVVLFLVAVLFFVSVYGVREGFECDKNKTYKITTGSGGIQTYDENCGESNMSFSSEKFNGTRTTYYGVPDTTNKLTLTKLVYPCKKSKTWSDSYCKMPTKK